MDLTCAEVCVPGPVRPNNEDCAALWQPESPDRKRDLGSVALLADGVGGQNRGEIASQLAVQSALGVFQAAEPATAPRKLLRQMFDAASRAVYDDALRHPEHGRMATTLTVSIFRNNEVTIGYVGDTRAYLIHSGRIRQLTTDHNYLGFQAKHGLIHERHAMTSPLRSKLTRSLGGDPICRFDSLSQVVFDGDFLVHCTDGLYGFVTDAEICEAVTHLAPAEACRSLLALAEKRQGEDNISLQVIRIEQVDKVISYRGATLHQEAEAPKRSDELKEGHLLDQRFLITDCLSRSGMAMIYKATDLKRSEPVAIKVPHLRFESDVATFTRFEQEEQIGKTLDHPCILKIIPVEEQKSRPYIVMEYLDGQTLDEVLRQVRPLPEPDAAKIASRICAALDYLHRKNVVHRDLKPQNIMMCNDGSLRIMDFGIAKSTQARRMTFVGFTPAMGTPDYMAPEQVTSKRGDERTDIYSLGAILYEMATGAVPFEGENPYVVMNSRLTGDPVAPRKINPKLTPVLEEIILHAMERSPAGRYPSAAAMQAELDDYEKVPLTSRWERLQPPQLWKTRFRLLPMIAGFVVLQIVLFLFLWWFFRHKGAS